MDLRCAAANWLSSVTLIHFNIEKFNLFYFPGKQKSEAKYSG